MDRLHVVIWVTAVTCLLGCDDKAKATSPAPTSRVNAVVAKKEVAEPPEDFCDVYHSDAAGAPEMTYPELGSPLRSVEKGWTWVNVWATWCKPCVEEMPRLVAWEGELASKGLGGVVFVSADDTEQLMTTFLKEHPEIPHSARLAAADSLQPWLNGLGLAGSPSLPSHLFLDEEKKVRCIRMGGVSDHDRPAVERLLNGE